MTRGLVVVFVLPVAYVLSIGPVMRLEMAGVYVPGTEPFYRPLVFATMYSPRLDRAMRWYVWNVWHVPMMKD
jgi:hypothetical protein